MPELLLLRHAQSEWNAVGRWQGQADPPLSAEGKEQVGQAAARLRAVATVPFTRVVSSDLRRAAETAEILRSGLDLPRPVVADPALRERDMGRWSGLTRDEIEAAWPGQVEALRDGRIDGPPSGETTDAFRQRAARAVEGLVTGAGPAARLLVVAHGGLIRALLETLGARLRPVGHCCGMWLAAGVGGLSPGLWVELLDEETVPAQQAV